MVESSVTIVNSLGLHARAASRLVRLAAQYRSTIRIKRVDNFVNADAKSILSVLTLAASKGVVLTIECSGEDEGVALAAISALFAEGFGEDL